MKYQVKVAQTLESLNRKSTALVIPPATEALLTLSLQEEGNVIPLKTMQTTYSITTPLPQIKCAHFRDENNEALGKRSDFAENFS